MAEVLTSAGHSGGTYNPTIRRIGVADLRRALAAGYEDFRAIPTQLVFLCLLYPVIGFIAARAAVGDLLPLLFPLLAGLSLMGPVMAIGLYEISRQREQGRDVSWLTAFDVLKSPAIGSIVVMGLLLLVIFGAWVLCAQAIYNATMGPVTQTSMGAFANEVMHSNGGAHLILLGNAVGAAFAVVVLAISVISLPMILDRQSNPVVAIRTSVRAVLTSPVTFLLWGLTVAVILAVGALPAFVGLAVAMPILGHATWHLYRATIA